MYCSSCGVAVTQNLSYCNHCGAKINRNDSVTKSSEVEPDLLVQLMAATFILGLIAITILMGVMKAVLGLPVGQILALLSLPFLLMLMLEGVFIRQLLRRGRGGEAQADKKLSKEHATNELDAAQARVLPEGVQSVTEHTTRAFDSIYNERKKRKNNHLSREDS